MSFDGIDHPKVFIDQQDHPSSDGFLAHYEDSGDSDNC